MNSTDIAIYCLGVISMIFYGVTYFPQMYQIWKTKTSEGVSIWTALLWCQADALSLVGSILLQLDLMIIIICWYHFFMDLIMIAMVIYFGKTNDKKMISYVAIFVAVNILANCLINSIYYNYNDKNNTDTLNLVGEILAWVTTVVYIIGRIPQILHLQTSIEGLSVLMFAFAIGGNSTYLGLLILQDQPMANLAWMVLCLCLILMDLYVIFTIEIKKRVLNKVGVATV
jgi:uncharacterized protein with PQ loop repeat